MGIYWCNKLYDPVNNMKIIYFLAILLIINNILLSENKREIKLENETILIGISKDWRIVNKNDLEENIEKIDFSSYHQSLYEGLPNMVFKKETDKIKIKPTFSIKLVPKSLNSHNFYERIRKESNNFIFILNDFSYLVEPKIIRIDDILSGYSVFSHTLKLKYDIESLDERNLKVVSAVWFLPIKNQYILIGCGLPFENFEIYLDEINGIISSIEFKKK